MVMNRLLLTVCLVLLAFRELPLTAGRLMDGAQVKDAEIPSKEQHRQLLFFGGGDCAFWEVPGRYPAFNPSGPNLCVGLCIPIFYLLLFIGVPGVEFGMSCMELGEACSSSEECIDDAGCGRVGGPGEFACCAKEDFIPMDPPKDDECDLS